MEPRHADRGFNPRLAIAREATVSGSSSSMCSGGFNPRLAIAREATAWRSPTMSHSSRFQSALRDCSRGDLIATKINLFSPVSIRASRLLARRRRCVVPIHIHTRFQSAPRDCSRGDEHPARVRALIGRFNPRLAIAREATLRVGLAGAAVLVSIRASRLLARRQALPSLAVCNRAVSIRASRLLARRQALPSLAVCNRAVSIRASRLLARRPACALPSCRE